MKELLKDKKKLLFLVSAIALVLVAAIVIVCLVTCGNNNDETNNDQNNAENNNQNNTDNNQNNTPATKTYTLALAVDTTIGADNKVSNYVTALVLDDANKIVAVRIDCVETTPVLENGAIKDVASVTSKVSLGDGYSMLSGSFAKQTKAFEDAIVGKTSEEVAALDMTLVSGCTMPYSPFSFKAVVAKAFASTNKTTFTTADTFTLGVAADMSVSGGKVSTYYAATAVTANKIAANIIDCNEVSFTVEGDAIVAGAYNGTKVELGDAYAMLSGSFAKQTAAFEDAIVGKTAEEVAALDMTLVSGCTMPYSPFSFKAVVANAITNAR